jgi:hypothetical protein
VTGRLFRLPPEITDRLERSAADEGKGGWQNLCADILRYEVDDENPTAREAKARGVDHAIECLQALRAALEED